MLPPVAIPSYGRSHLLYRKTLRYLRDSGYPRELITIFVATKEEQEAYRRATPELLYGSIVVGVKGLAEQRNFISEYYPEGSYIFQMDDDVCGHVGGIRLLELVEWGVKLLEEQGAGLFSILPNSDTRRIKNDYTLHLTHCIGSWFILKNHREFQCVQTEMEDYLRSIWYFKKYGKVIRFRGAGVKTSYGKTEGGLQQPGRIQRIQESCELLSNTFPEFCKMIYKNGRPDLKLNWRAVSKCYSNISGKSK